ncbi:MAG: SH3 domain-containing protein [Planctomycetes bacterium]|nr:SH3 domain-containing protein [Planctomycetota bacterium]
MRSSPLLAVGLAAGLSVCLALPAWGQALEVTASTLNVRDAPWGTVIDRAPRGLRLAAGGERSGFFSVDWGARTGWVHAGHVRRTSDPLVEVTAASLNVREGPSTAQRALGQARSGQRFVSLARSGDWVRVQFGPRAGWVHGAYVRDVAGGAPPPAPTPPAPTPPPAGGGWRGVHAGLTLDGAQIPRAGLANPTLRRALGVAVEPYGDAVTLDGRAFVRGLVSWFGGRDDTGVTPTETGAITGENLRALNGGAAGPSDADRARRPENYYYVAMRWDYAPKNRTWWRDARLLVVAPDTGKAVVVRPVDWGPHTRTRRVVDLSPQALRDLGLRTDQAALISFAAPGTPLGPVR